jgi:hypothetical protein
MRQDSCSRLRSCFLGNQSRWKGYARLFRPMVPDFLHGAPPTDACAAFIKESRMEFVNAKNSTGNPGVR